MKTNRLLLFLVLACFSITSFGQYQTFDLGKYSNPYYKRQQLDLNFNLNGRKYTNEYSNSNYYSNYSNAQFNGLISGTYKSVVNSLKLQQDWGVNLDDSPSYSDRNSNDKYYLNPTNIRETKYNNLSNRLNLYLNNTNRFYFKGLTFFELGLNFQYLNQFEKYKSENSTIATDTTSGSTIDRYKYSNIFGTIGLRFGKGRLEYVQDARLALYILENLQKQGRLTRTMTDEEILDFSKTITQIKNKRFFDTRIRKIEEITKIDSFLNANNLVSKSDAAYFTTLNDNWDNASEPQRMVGLRYSVGLLPEYYSSINNHTNDNSLPQEQKSELNNYGLSIDGQLDFDKPLNLYWQLKSGMNLRYRLLKETSKTTDQLNINFNLKEFTSTLYVTAGFYPTSRTTWDATIGLLYKNATHKLTSENIPTDNPTSTYNLIQPYFSLYGNYYISQRLRFQATYQFNYSKSHDKNDFYSLGNNYYPNGEQFNNYFNIGLTYMLF